MDPLYTCFEQSIWYLICILVIVNLVGYTCLEIEAVLNKEDRCAAFKYGMGFLISLFLFTLLSTDGYDEKHFIFMPWLVILGIIVLLSILLVAEVRKYRQRRQERITSEAIRIGINYLPEGLMLAKANGEIIITNIAMYNFMRELTGKVIIRLNDLWDYVVLYGQQHDHHYILHDGLKRTWFLKKESLEIDGEDYIQVMAVEITKRYAIIDELHKKHAHLEEIKQRMRKVSKISGDMFVAREEAKARVALHNQLGQVLLMGKYCIEHPDRTDLQNIHALTKQMNQFLLEEALDVLETDHNDINQIKEMASSIGMNIHFQHEDLIPLIHPKIFVHALQEASTNAIKHGGANHLYVNIMKEGSVIEVIFTDDGKVQKETFIESGGLKSLRRIVEEYGGKMLTYYQSGFVLKLVLPENGTNG